MKDEYLFTPNHWYTPNTLLCTPEFPFPASNHSKFSIFWFSFQHHINLQITNRIESFWPRCSVTFFALKRLHRQRCEQGHTNQNEICLPFTLWKLKNIFLYLRLVAGMIRWIILHHLFSYGFHIPKFWLGCARVWVNDIFRFNPSQPAVF